MDILAKNEESAIRAVIGESVRQRRTRVIRWVIATLVFTLIAAGSLVFLLLVGFKAGSDDIQVRTEIQDGWNGNPEWVIHFETVKGGALFCYTEAADFPSDDGESSVPGRIIHLRVAPLGQSNPDNYTWGYSIAGGLAPTEEYDYYVIVDYKDGPVKYSMRTEGLFRS